MRSPPVIQVGPAQGSDSATTNASAKVVTRSAPGKRFAGSRETTTVPRPSKALPSSA